MPSVVTPVLVLITSATPPRLVRRIADVLHYVVDVVEERRPRAWRAICHVNTHRNARLTFARRLELAECVVRGTVTLQAAAAKHGVSLRTARKWVTRYRSGGAAGLHDRSSRPHRILKKRDDARTAMIMELRRQGLTMSSIAKAAGCSIATVSRICSLVGLSRLSGWGTDPVPRRKTGRLKPAMLDNAASQPAHVDDSSDPARSPRRGPSPDADSHSQGG